MQQPQILYLRNSPTLYFLGRAASLVDFYIEFEFSLFYEFEFKFEFNIFIFASSGLRSSAVKIYQVFSSSENKVIDLA